jgi:hypothetical protein
MGLFDFTNGFAPSSPYYGDAAGALQGIGGLANTELGIGAGGMNQYNRYNGQSLDDYNNLADYYKNLFNNGPSASMQNTALMQNGAGQIAGNYANALNSLYAANYKRGLGNSSLTGGAQAYLASQQANQIGSLTNQYANWYMQNRPNFMAQAAGILGNAANQGLYAAQNAYGMAGNDFSRMAGGYSGLGQADVQNQMSGWNNFNRFAGGLSNLAGGPAWQQ